ncbi:hypothetical protein F4819DRAFT_458173 [Hypoxylon fuscum]|nr:hypothetical protein F4819DRAFT_458173 [Hypoxylon fuscum]
MPSTNSRMHCYCANYYGAVNCQNKVRQFGERCKLCTVMNEGRPAKPDLFKINDNDYAYAYDSEAVEDDSNSSSSHSDEERRGRTRKRSNTSSN